MGGARLEVGRIGRAHGLRGEVVRHAGDATSPSASRRAPRCGSTIGRYVVAVRRARTSTGSSCASKASTTATAPTRCGARLVEAEPLDEAPEGEFWVHELIGSEVRDRAGAALGTVVAVEANPAHDLLVLDGGALVPMVFVVSPRVGRRRGRSARRPVRPLIAE